MAKGKVVLIPFPFDDLSDMKVRPAVCLTDGIGEHGHVVLAFITSNIAARPLDTDYVLEANQPDFPLTGLRVSSTIRLHRMITVTDRIILRELGELSQDMQGNIEEKLRELFGL
ncbi:MAG: type II toxin-antitoxin system PemK/MazF family toxin [Chloroflexia bacterium]